MLRVLHLLGHDVDWETERTSDALRQVLVQSTSTTVRRIGAGKDYRNIFSAFLALRREPWDLIHAWGETALFAAAPAAHAPMIFSPCRPPTRRLAVWLSTVLAHRNLSLVCRSGQQQLDFCKVGIAPDQCHVIRPGIAPSPDDRKTDRSLRESLNLADDDYLVFAPGESTHEANHELAVWVSSILHVLDPRYKLLLWGRGSRSAHAARLAGRLGHPGLCRFADQCLASTVELDRLAPAADLVLFTGHPSASTLGLGLCMAAGLPIVAAQTAATSELLENEKSALMTPPDSARLLAQRIVELRENTGLSRALGNQTRQVAAEKFSMPKFVELYGDLYLRLGRRAKQSA